MHGVGVLRLDLPATTAVGGRHVAKDLLDMRAAPGEGGATALGTLDSTAHQTPPALAARGANARHGPHQEAQKSSNTMPCFTVVSNVVSVTCTVAILASMSGESRSLAKGFRLCLPESFAEQP